MSPADLGGVQAAPAFDDHRLVQFVHDPDSGLRAIVALHRLRPTASGGIRMKPYATEADALHDALRLSRAMTFKFAFAGLRVGGGKTVVIGDSRRDKTDQLLKALARAIDRLSGAYVAGSDVGTSHADMARMQQTTPHVRGAHPDHGDSSEATAYGVLRALEAGVERTLGGDLRGVRVGVQGLGHVGGELARLLHERGARLTVADVDGDAVAKAQKAYNAVAVAPDDILEAEVDVLAPCALGGILNARTIPTIKARLICGAANNQLATEADGQALHVRGVAFVPDYVASAGGIINGVAEGPAYDRARVWRRLDRIHDRCLEMFDAAERWHVSVPAAADRMALEMLDAAGG